MALNVYSDFSRAVVNPQKGFINDLNSIIYNLHHSSCSSRKLREYDLFLEMSSADQTFSTKESRVMKRVQSVRDFISQKLKNQGVQLSRHMSQWLNRAPVFLNEQVLKKAYPEEFEEIRSLIVNKAQKLCFKGAFSGRSVTKELYTLSGKRLFVTYRIRNCKLQILVYQNLKQGAFSLVQKVALVYGANIKGAPGTIFARLKLQPFLRSDPLICAQVRTAAFISQSLIRGGANNIIEYSFISRSRTSTTLAAPLYKENVWEMLQNHLQGPSTSETAFSFLTKIAIPVAKALVDIHKRGGAHLDLKLENVLLSETGQAFLGDFGTYRNIGDQETNQLTTPTVAAPELFSSTTPWSVTPAPDMWAFGLFLVDLFCGPQRNAVCSGWPPFFDKLSSDYKRAYITSQAEEIVKDLQGKPSSLDAGFVVPEKLVDLIVQLLNPDPIQRPNSSFVLKELITLRNTW